MLVTKQNCHLIHAMTPRKRHFHFSAIRGILPAPYRPASACFINPRSRGTRYFRWFPLIVFKAEYAENWINFVKIFRNNKNKTEFCKIWSWLLQKTKTISKNCLLFPHDDKPIFQRYQHYPPKVWNRFNTTFRKISWNDWFRSKFHETFSNFVSFRQSQC